MSDVQSLLDHLTAVGVHVETTEDGKLRILACLDEPISSETRTLCRAHREELLAYAEWAAQADRMLLDSHARLAMAWPRGCAPLDDDHAWDEMERWIHHTYWAMDRDGLRAALADREAYALQVFGRCRKEVCDE